MSTEEFAKIVKSKTTTQLRDSIRTLNAKVNRLKDSDEIKATYQMIHVIKTEFTSRTGIA